MIYSLGQEPKFGVLVPLGGTKYDNAFWLGTCLRNMKKLDGHLERPAKVV